MQNKMLNYFIKNLVVLMTIFLISCGQKTEDNQEETENPCLTESEISDLNLITVSHSEVVQKLRLNGRVVYDPNAVIHYVSLVGGTVTNTYFSLGDKVKKGQVLAEIKSSELNSMQAEVNQLKAKLRVANRELQSVQDFYDDKVASERELISAQSEKENLESELDNLKNNLALFSARSKNGVYQILAPRSGFVVENKIVQGMRFSAESDPLFTISDLEKVWINLNIYAADIDVIKEGMQLDITSTSYPDKVFKAEIERVTSVIDTEENVLKAWAVLENEDLILKPGLHVEAIVKIEKDQQAPRLPAEAMVFFNDKYYVVVLEDCHTTYREIEVLFQDENSVFVKDGLSIGEQIVSKNALTQFEHSYSKH